MPVYSIIISQIPLTTTTFFSVGIGMAYWSSTICADEDIMWSYYRRLHDPDAMQELNLKYKRPDVRSRWYFMCRVWGSGFLLEAAIRLILIYSIPVHIMVYLNTALFVMTMSSLGCWTKWYVASSRRQQVAAENRRVNTTMPHVREIHKEDFNVVELVIVMLSIEVIFPSFTRKI
ncbi:hypothetical protein AC1031_020013 [Aphanomyces cochlioides]|nr:hypothetical protein AC1031_020013 [Aphanomyces cochlioides]